MMLVYGDHQFEAPLHALREQLRLLSRRALGDRQNLDLLRHLLIVCGQVEQGVSDSLPRLIGEDEARPWILCFQEVTACAAEAFYCLVYRQHVMLPKPVVGIADALHRLLERLERLHEAPDIVVTIKVPEGFSIYALYPEQYLLAAAQWLAEHGQPPSQEVLVIGIRTIGTTLAAVVSCVLRAAGWQMRPMSVRPVGDPFGRVVDLGGSEIDPGAYALIVDEGPGISGSSMAATARALVEAGIPRRNITFFPGHANDPGGAGSEEVKRWWRETSRYVGHSSKLLFDGMTLQASLAASLPEGVRSCEELSGGLWRQYVYGDRQAWPAVCSEFERVKYRFTLESGKRVIFKFLGTASNSPTLESTAEEATQLLEERSKKGLSAPVLAMRHGFVGVEWIDGTPAGPGSLSPSLIRKIGGYIARVGNEPLSDDDVHAGVERLREMLYVNTMKSLGEEAARLTNRFQPDKVNGFAAYGDGHMQPYEWIAADGIRAFSARHLIKVDSVGHDCDHTLIGKQPIVWDLAGAMVEWRMDRAAVELLLDAYCACGGRPIAAKTLAFYRAAYLAFRLGQCSLAAQVHDEYERERLVKAAAMYRQALATLLQVSVPAGAL